MAAPKEAYEQLSRLAASGIHIPTAVRDTIVVGMYQANQLNDPAKLVKTDEAAARATARLLRPHDLYLAFWTRATDRDGNSLANQATLPSALTTFPLDAVLPADSRLYKSVYEVIPELYSRRVWDRQRTVVTVDTLVKRCAQPDSARQMLG